MSSARHLQHGRSAEEQACAYLRAQGLELLERNYRAPCGEIDIIMLHQDALVFVEVRYRQSATFGTAAETVNRRKQEKLRATAAHFLVNHPRLADRPCRFDVVAISSTAFDWLQDAFGLPDHS